MAKLKHLSFSFLFYTGVTALEALTPIVLIPILTRYLTRYDYGLWSIFQAVVAVLIPVISLSFRDYVRMRYLSMDRDGLRVLLNGSVLTMMLMAVLGIIVILLFHEPLEYWLKLGPLGLLATIGITLCYGIFYLALAVCQFANERKTFAIIQLMQSTVTIILTAGLVYYYREWQACVFGRLIGLTFAASASLYFLYKKMGCFRPMQINKAIMLKLIRFGYVYLPSGLFVIVVALTNRIYIANKLGLEETSLYAVTESLAMMLSLVITGFIYALQPWLFKKMSGQDEHGMEHVGLACFLFVLGVPFAGFVMSMIAELLIPYVLGKEFQLVTLYLLPVLLVVSMQGWLLLVKAFLHFYNRIEYMTICGSIVMVSNALLGWYLIPAYHLYGAALASGSAYVLGTISGLMCLGIIRKNAQNNIARAA